MEINYLLWSVYITNAAIVAVITRISSITYARTLLLARRPLLLIDLVIYYSQVGKLSVGPVILFTARCCHDITVFSMPMLHKHGSQ